MLKSGVEMNTFEISEITGFKHEVVLRQVKKYFAGNPNVVIGEAYHECNNQTHTYFKLPNFELAYYVTAMDDIKLSQKIMSKTNGIFVEINDSWDAMTSTLDGYQLSSESFKQLRARHARICERVERKLIDLGLDPKDYKCVIAIEGNEVEGYELSPELNFVFAHGVVKQRKEMIEYLMLRSIPF